MKPSDHERLTIELPSELMRTLRLAANDRGLTAEIVVAECVEQQWASALRFRVLLERQEQIDQAVVDIAGFVGNLSAEVERPVSDICRYNARRDK